MNNPTFERIENLMLLPHYHFDEWLKSLCITFGEDHNYYYLLYHLILEYKPKVCLEIGTWWGIGSAFMSMAASTYGGKTIGIDLYPHDLTSRVLPDRYYNYYFVRGSSISPQTVNTIKELTCNNIGLVFQDSSHHYNPSCQEWEIYSQMLAPNAIWICDDITSDFYNLDIDPPGKGMVQYFEDRPGQKKIYANCLHKGNSMGIILQ